MAGGDEPGRWFVKARGRVLGPLTWAQLESLRDRGQLARFNQVSQDRQSWISAASLVRLFPHVEGAGPSLPTASGRATLAASTARLDEFIILDDADADSSASTARTAQEAPTWFFARDGARHGPLRLSALQGMADGGEIAPDTLLWKSGMEDWTPGFLVPELSFPAGAGAPAAPIGPAAPPSRQWSGVPVRANPGPRTSPLAFASLVLGLLWLCGIGSLAAIVLGVVSQRQIARSNGTLTGKSLAIAGLILGIVGLAILALALSSRANVPGHPESKSPITRTIRCAFF
jgi:hypothetical protein